MKFIEVDDESARIFAESTESFCSDSFDLALGVVASIGNSGSYLTLCAGACDEIGISMLRE